MPSVLGSFVCLLAVTGILLLGLDRLATKLTARTTILSALQNTSSDEEASDPSPRAAMRTGMRSGDGASSSTTLHSPPLTSSRVSAAFIFYPRPIPRTTISVGGEGECWLYGWREGNATVVAGAIEAEALTEDAATAVLVGATLKLAGTLGSSLGIVGRLCRCEGAQIGKGKGKASTTLDLHENKAGIPSICGGGGERTTLIIYTPPVRSQLQFFSLTPLQFNLHSVSSLDEVDPDAPLSEKVRQGVKLDFTKGNGVDVANLELIVDWINLAPQVAGLVRLPLRSDQSRVLAGLSMVVVPFRHPLRLLRILAQGYLQVSNYELPLLGGTALKDLSATVQQIDTRLSQGLSWPAQYSVISSNLHASTRAPTMASLAVGGAHYIQFYNTMWLIANDVIFGSAFASFFCENSEYLGWELGNLIQVYTLDSLRELLLWLNDWPGGVKLNYELAKIFCDGFLWGTGVWEEVVFIPLRPLLPALVYTLGVTGFLGTTMFFSFASDLLSLLTLHLFAFYVMATSLFGWHLSMLGALFNLFRGKKFNVLRNRVEPATYEVDQLLLGTILFTLAAFLFPTVLAYYLAFAAGRVGIVILHAAMETALVFMNHFPLFTMMLRFKDPKRLPGGIQFEVQETRDGPYLSMSNNPIGLSGIFVQHVQLSRRLASHYSPFYLGSRLLSGRMISPIPRVRLTLSVTQDESTS